MYRYKRIVRAMVGILVAVGVTACSNQTTYEVLEEDNSDLVVIGFSQPGAESAWRVALTDSVKENFTEDRGYKLIYRDGRSKQDNQIKDIRTFIQQGVDYIIISPIVETGWDTVLSEAKDAGIPVIVCDRNVVVGNENLYTAFVGSDFKAEGEAAVSNLEKVLEQQESEDGQVNIVHIQGTIGSSAQIGRTKAIEEAVEEHPGWNIISQDCGEFTKAKSREIMTQILEEIGEENIDVVYCENDEEAYGAISAMNEADVGYGNDEGIKIVSFDAMNTALVLCMNGKISVEAECNPLQGPYIYKLVSRLERGNAVPKITYVHEECFISDDLTPDLIEKRRF